MTDSYSSDVHILLSLRGHLEYLGNMIVSAERDSSINVRKGKIFIVFTYLKSSLLCLR